MQINGQLLGIYLNENIDYFIVLIEFYAKGLKEKLKFNLKTQIVN